MRHPRPWLITFLASAALLLAIVPGINLWQRGFAPLRLTGEFFNLDIFVRAFSTPLSRLGISTSPQGGIIGKDGWLFPGDQYAESISARRRGENDADKLQATHIADATQAWNGWLHLHGVGHFHILVCADKESVYPGELPDWYRPSPERPINGLMKRVDASIYVDTRQSLSIETSSSKYPTYFHTDSHWTSAGAWTGYRALADASARTGGGDTTWLQATDVSAPAVLATTSGDIAHLLHLNASLGDLDAAMSPAGAFSEGRALFDAPSGKALEPGVLSSLFVPGRGVRISSPHALNAARLLWLRDSFGKALLPYLASTYQDIIEVNRAGVTPEQFARLVQDFKPRDVLISVVERNARETWFEKPPPPGR